MVIRAVVFDIGGVLEITPDLGVEQLAQFMADLWREYVDTANAELIEYARRLRPRYRTGIVSRPSRRSRSC